MDSSTCKSLNPSNCNINATIFKFSTALVIILALHILFLTPQNTLFLTPSYRSSYSNLSVRPDKFLEVPQIIWGLNNQKIAFARACLTARLLNRTLLMPNLTANLVYKEINSSEPIPFNKVYNLEKFNSMCKGFVQVGLHSTISNKGSSLELNKGSGRKWTKEKDMNQLTQFAQESCDKYEVIKIVGKNPFLWHDHWPVKDYAKVFQCLALVDEIEEDAAKVIAKLRQGGDIDVPYVAVHMRIELDWMIHCKKVEQRYNKTQICSSKEEIMDRVAKISESLPKPIAVYLAIADSLVQDDTILSGWKEGLIPYEKKKLGVWEIYQKYPYIVQAAMDFEVCLRANVFVGNSYSTFSSLVVLQRTQELDRRFLSYAYNIMSIDGGAQRWITDLSASSLESISYGTDNISTVA